MLSWRALAGACCLASSVAWLAGAAAGSATGSGSGRAATVRVLQLNLCDSGIAPCYTGRSVAAAAALLRTDHPDVVTLNEVCRSDVSTLQRAMAGASPGASVAAAFRPAVARATGRAFRCLNGQQYGDGVLAALPSAHAAYRTDAGVYPMQDRLDPEERVWACLHASGYLACTTHAASTSTSIALAQCRYFFATAVPSALGRTGTEPVVLGADLNLPAGRAPGPQSCLPAGYQRVDDGARQDVVSSPGTALRRRAVVDLHGTTDHPGLLVDAVLTGAVSRPSGPLRARSP